ncbi:hypothetical protein ACFQY0_19830 [Haloferula chungangensis]|uniref:DUF98 domain-containing protein n=1 Tax=Haloferula chungangensis TaxID=1048331 RepID=A0ABW2LAH9_9BACT
MTSAPHLPAELDNILSHSHLAVAPLEWLPPEAVPEPYHRLLVHDHDMTSELERFHGDAITLKVIHSEQNENLYLREVTLHTSIEGKPAEYGLIEILLDHFPTELRPKILAGDTPLGAILNQSGLTYHSQPQGFLSVPAESLKVVFKKTPGSAILYGRYNHLIRSDDGSCLARIIEILPT